MCSLQGQTALVTGGAQGIGYGIALELARAGGRVVIADRDLARAQRAAEELKKSGHEAVALLLDVTDEKTIDQCMQAAIAHFGAIDILVNNAGIHCEKLGEPSTVEQFSRCLDVNLLGVWRTTQALLPHFRSRRAGKIVNIASINGRKPWVDTPGYSASKAGVINLTQALAMRLGADNINVNAVCPGGVMTPMAEAFTSDLKAFEADIIQSRLLKRPLLPEDIGHAVVFLTSPQAKNITGQALNVDGGTVLS
ncbi:MAG: SDR family oxidoreductase [Gammaproteobacteria bacterium]|nr:SDR family oxidoreductase [Gammaproteobacteria bacterium]